MKKLLLILLISSSLLAGCGTRMAYDLTFIESREVDSDYIVTFKTNDNEEVHFFTNQEWRIDQLEVGAQYKVRYNFGGLEYDYSINHIEIYNEALEGEDD